MVDICTPYTNLLFFISKNPDFMPFVKPLRCYCIVLIQKTLNDGRYLNCLVQYLSSSRAKSLILCRFFSHSFSCSVLLLTKLQKSIIKTAIMPLSNSLYSTILLSIPCQIYLCPIFGVYFTIWNPLLAQFHCIYFGCFRQSEHPESNSQ